MSSTRGGRPGRTVRSATFASGLLGAAHTLREAGESVADAALRWRDPRERLLRKKRRARRRARRFGVLSGLSVIGLIGLALLSAPEWSMLMAGGGAVVFAVPAVIAVGSWRRLDSVTLPPGLPARRALPDPASVAREPMERLVRSERALYGVLGVLSRAGAVDAESIEDIDSTARSAAQVLEAVAVDITAMENATSGGRAASESLSRAIESAAGQLDDGVGQFEKFVAAAAEVAAPRAPGDVAGLAAGDVGGLATGDIGGLAHVQAELVSATEKLSGLAAALGEIDDIVRRYR